MTGSISCGNKGTHVSCCDHLAKLPCTDSANLYSGLSDVYELQWCDLCMHFGASSDKVLKRTLRSIDEGIVTSETRV